MDLVAGSTLQLKTSVFRLPTRILGYVLLAMWLASLTQVRDFHDLSFMCIALPFVASLMAFGHYLIPLSGIFVSRRILDGKRYSFTFTPENYRVQSPGADATISWNNVMEVLVSKKGFLIQSNRYSATWVPVHSFPDREAADKFVSLLQEAGVKLKQV